MRGTSFLLLSLLVSHAAGQPDSSTCSLAKPDDVVRYALENHPSIRRANAAKLQGSSLENVARRLPNPELGTKTTFGVGGDHSLGAEISLAQPIELGGKRSSRVERALAENESLDSEVIKAKEEVVIGTILSLYRLRHAREEKQIADETLLTFQRILKQFHGRPQLTPEQRVGLDVFQMAQADYELRKSTLESTEKSLEKSLSLATGQPMEGKTGILPARKIDWPDLQDVPSAISHSSMRLMEANVKVARAELSSAQSLSWPDVRLGPTYEMQPEGGTSRHALGFNLSFSIPILNGNGAGREYAAQGVQRAEQSLALLKMELTNDREVHLIRYRGAVAALNKIAPLVSHGSARLETESLVERGLVPSSLVIETKRQVLEFAKSRNEQELVAIEALWRIYALEGRLLKESL